MNTVTFFSDRTILPGTHAALVSLLKNNIAEVPIHIIVFCDELRRKDKADLEKTFIRHQKKHQSIEIRECPEFKISAANSLHGNSTAYGRLFIGNLLPKVDKVLYLDCDLIIQKDINE